ncbi:MAG: hypothetical protein PVF95_13375, partial [bacterium]
MIKLDSLYDFMGGNFDYVFVLDDNEEVVHASEMFLRDCLPPDAEHKTMRLEEVASDFSLGTFRTAMARARAGNRAIAVFSPASDSSRS